MVASARNDGGGRPNPFADRGVARRYQGWYATEGRSAVRQERALLRRLLAGLPPVTSVLEVGCGTGEFTRWFRREGYWTVGLDPAAAMLGEAVSLGTPRCVMGTGETLPFGDGVFDLVVLITTLEFTSSPGAVLAEASRVARVGLLLGVLNRHSLVGLRTRRAGGVWGAAHLYTPRELSAAVREVAGGSARIEWRTTLLPLTSRSFRLPWGGFIGMAVTLQEVGGGRE